MAWDRDTKLFQNVAFQQPRIHDLDHRAVVASILRGRPGRLKRCCQCCQTFPLQLPSVEEQDEQTRLFGELRKSCKEDALMGRKRNDWISEESWRLIAHRAMLCRTGRLCQTRGASSVPSNWCVALQGPCQVHEGGWDSNRVQSCGGECAGGLLPP
jgi:hypothetical protein